MKVLALDLATKTGWATSTGQYGVKDFGWTGETPYGRRWLDFKAWLSDRIANNVTHLAYEAALYQKGKAAHVAHCLVGVCEVVAVEWRLELAGFAVSSIKKHATGNGRAQKPEMFEAAKKRGLLRAETDDVVDAVWLCDLALHSLDSEKWSKVA